MTVRGEVNARLEAVLRLPLRGPDGVVVEVDALVDTGYNGSLSLPSSLVSTLGLERRSGIRVVLADGTSRLIDTFVAEVEWGGSWRNTMVFALENAILVGMRLLAGHELRIEAIPDGKVVVTKITSKN